MTPFATAAELCRLALPLAGLALAACTAPAPLPPGSRYPAPSAVPISRAHKVVPSVQPSTDEAMELAAFLESLPPDRALSARIVGRRARGGDAGAAAQLAAARTRNVARLVRDRLAIEPALAIAADDDAGTGVAGEVEVRVETVEVVLPACPDWSRDPAFDYRNLPLSNLGCANAINLGLMVADPADLARPRRMGPADGVREADAITRYRTDKVKELEADVLTK